jgi:hypothetical protein
MKNLIVAIVLFIPITAFSELIHFQCISSDVAGIHKFEANGVIVVDDFSQVEGIASIITEKADSAQSRQSFDDVNISGYIRHFSAGEVTKEEFDQVVLKADAPYLKSLNLLLGLKENISSRALSVDNFVFRSNCKVTDLLKKN